jgi:Gdp/GTP exchange factor required for growth at low temperatures
MAGLQSEWVTKVMRTIWGRVGTWEKRVFDDLSAWTDAKDDFKFIRQAITAMIDAKPINAGSHAPSIISTGATDGQSSRSRATSDGKPFTPPGCIPFIGQISVLPLLHSSYIVSGIYLSQLYRHNKLPDVIDPTAPNEMVGVDPETGNFDAPAHMEVFSDLAPLPPSIQLEPLINVHKQRLIADVIKMLVAGQHLAGRVQYLVDKKLFQKCLKIRGLSSEMLLRAQAMYE